MALVVSKRDKQLFVDPSQQRSLRGGKEEMVADTYQLQFRTWLTTVRVHTTI